MTHASLKGNIQNCHPKNISLLSPSTTFPILPSLTFTSSTCSPQGKRDPARHFFPSIKHMCIYVLNWVAASLQLICPTLSISRVINKMWKIKQNSVQQCLTGIRRMLSMKILSRRSKIMLESALEMADPITSWGHFPQWNGWFWGINSLHNVLFCWDHFSVTSHRILKNNYWALWRLFFLHQTRPGNAIP